MRAGHLMDNKQTDAMKNLYLRVGMAEINADTLSFFQIKITYEQAQHMPSARILDYFSKAEMIFVLGGDRVISSSFDDPKCLEGNDELKDSFEIENILQEGKFCLCHRKTPGPLQSILAKHRECWMVPPSIISRKEGFFMTVQGTPMRFKTCKR